MIVDKEIAFLHALYKVFRLFGADIFVKLKQIYTWTTKWKEK
jgi:hypothetical protein